MVTEFISSFWYKYIFLKICCFTSYLMVSHKSRKVVNNFWTIIFFPKEYHFISFHLRTVKPWIWEPEKLKKYPKEKYANSLCFSGSWTFQTCYQWPSSVSFGDDLVMGAYQRSMSTFLKVFTQRQMRSQVIRLIGLSPRYCPILKFTGFLIFLLCTVKRWVLWWQLRWLPELLPPFLFQGCKDEGDRPQEPRDCGWSGDGCVPGAEDPWGSLQRHSE